MLLLLFIFLKSLLDYKILLPTKTSEKTLGYVSFLKVKYTVYTVLKKKRSLKFINTTSDKNKSVKRNCSHAEFEFFSSWVKKIKHYLNT